ncbi:MAG: methyl-accepting chemotaxis protein [Desulfobacteraceae bacterium]|nr:MAG: methyl-accepting chemotaxis protein [Desulfobacteraceae bacterium]
MRIASRSGASYMTEKEMVMKASLRAKMLLAFLFIALITAVVGITGYYGMRTLDSKFQEVTESAPLIRTATQMKLVISQDLMMVMKLMAALDTEELADAWKIHETHIQEFDRLKKAILNGAQLNTGTVFPARDEALRSIVTTSSEFHINAFAPSFEVIYDQMNKQLSAEPYDYNLLDTIDEATIALGHKLDLELDKVVQIAQTVINRAEKEAHEARTRAVRITLAATVTGILLAVVLGVVFSGVVTRPIIRTAKFTRMVADGDFTRTLDIERNDEIGVMVSAVNKMVQSLGNMFRDIKGGVDTLNQTAGQLTDVSLELEKNAEAMSRGSDAVSRSSENMNERLLSVSSLSEESSTNLDTVSAAIEEMTASANEIAKNTAHARSITENAVQKAHLASDRVDKLGEDARQIGQVTGVIAEISDQTNLLALNATIEAARAGEAGRGFAVVANEIKDLANQTAQAAGDIQTRIDQIQQSTNGTVTQIEDISQVINHVNEIVISIAGAVEEQSATSGEISQNISHAAQGLRKTYTHITDSSNESESITRDISGVNENSERVSKSSHKVSESSSQLKTFAGTLNEKLSGFKI